MRLARTWPKPAVMTVTTNRAEALFFFPRLHSKANRFETANNWSRNAEA